MAAETNLEPRRRPPGRIRAALQALAGQPVVPAQIRAEWTGVQLELEGICDKIASAAARLQSRHKRELDRVTEELQEYKAREADPYHPSASGQSGYSLNKRLLNRRVLAARGVNVPDLLTNGRGNELRDQGEQGESGQ